MNSSLEISKSEFLDFCIDIMSESLRRSKEETKTILKNYEAEDFIDDFYDVEHTLPSSIIVQDIKTILKKNGWRR